MVNYICVDSAVLNIEMFAARAQVKYPPALKKSRVDDGMFFYFSCEMRNG